jgi:hypothetical protein
MKAISHSMDMTDTINKIEENLQQCSLKEAIIELCINTPIDPIM